MSLADAITAIIGPDAKLQRYQIELLEAWEEARRTGKPVYCHVSRPAGVATVRRIWAERLRQLSSRESTIS